jgi:hypothetical protein
MAAGTEPLELTLQAMGKNVVLPYARKTDPRDFVRYVIEVTRLGRERFGKGAMDVH